MKKVRQPFRLALRHDIETANIQPVDWEKVDRLTRKNANRADHPFAWRWMLHYNPADKILVSEK